MYMSLQSLANSNNHEQEISFHQPNPIPKPLTSNPRQITTYGITISLGVAFSAHPFLPTQGGINTFLNRKEVGQDITRTTGLDDLLVGRRGGDSLVETGPREDLLPGLSPSVWCNSLGAGG